jgi:hypothetical protein
MDFSLVRRARDMSHFARNASEALCAILELYQSAADAERIEEEWEYYRTSSEALYYRIADC